jgi:hypothetical protein
MAEGQDYAALWRREMEPMLRAAVVNRFVFALVGPPGWRLGAALLGRGDVARKFGALYRPSWFSRMLFPLARRRYRAMLRDRSCEDPGCTCVWCRCGDHGGARGDGLAVIGREGSAPVLHRAEGGAP